MGMDFYNRTTPKARKEYKCEDCGYGKMRSCPKNLKDFE